MRQGRGSERGLGEKAEEEERDGAGLRGDDGRGEEQEMTIVLAALREGGVDGEEGGLALQERRLLIRGRWRAILFSTPILIPIRSLCSARAEWLQWK